LGLLLPGVGDASVNNVVAVMTQALTATSTTSNRLIEADVDDENHIFISSSGESFRAILSIE